MQENNTCPKIIAINPGWRYLAIAVFDESGLREWRLKSLADKPADGKMEKIIEILSSFVERFNPDILAIKKLHPSRSSPNLKIMVSGIKTFCRKKRIDVFQYSIQEVESALSPRDKVNKRELIKLLTAEYPVLTYELKREERSRHQYFARLFEAVALGHVCLKAINNNI